MARVFDRNLVASLCTAGLFLSLGFTVAVGSYLVLVEQISPQYSGIIAAEKTARVFLGAELVPVSVSKFSVRGKKTVIEEFEGDQAIFASRANFSFKQYPFAEISVNRHSPFLNARLVWQGSAGTPSKSAILNFDRNGLAKVFIPPLTVDLDEKIESFALLFYDGPEIDVLNNDRSPLTIESVRFSPWSVANALAYMWHTISRSEHLASYSNNIERVFFFERLFSLNFVLNLSLFIGLMLFIGSRTMLPYSVRPSLPSVSTAMLLILFLLLEVDRWHWRAVQADGVIDRHIGLSLEQRTQRHYGRCTEFPDDCGKSLRPFY